MRQLSDYYPDLIYDEQVDMTFEPFDHVQGVRVFSEHPILYVNRDDFKVHCRRMQWGIIEYQYTDMPDMAARNGWLNIRAEKILADPHSYWFKIKSRRCLIPVSGIYEHRGVKGWTKKVPYWIQPKGQEVTFLPGLYSRAKIVDKNTGEVQDIWTFAVITRAANELMKHIHNTGDNANRMPLLLPLGMSMEFLSEDLTLKRYAEILDYEMPSEALDYHPVYTVRTSKLRPDNQCKSDYYEWAKLPPLGEAGPEASAQREIGTIFK